MPRLRPDSFPACHHACRSVTSTAGLEWNRESNSLATHARFGFDQRQPARSRIPKRLHNDTRCNPARCTQRRTLEPTSAGHFRPTDSSAVSRTAQSDRLDSRWRCHTTEVLAEQRPAGRVRHWHQQHTLENRWPQLEPLTERSAIDEHEGREPVKHRRPPGHPAGQAIGSNLCLVDRLAGRALDFSHRPHRLGIASRLAIRAEGMDPTSRSDCLATDWTWVVVGRSRRGHRLWTRHRHGRRAAARTTAPTGSHAAGLNRVKRVIRTGQIRSSISIQRPIASRTGIGG